MDKGYYLKLKTKKIMKVIDVVAIHNKNGQGLLLIMYESEWTIAVKVAIHNKNGQGLLRRKATSVCGNANVSQSTIKMDKGYYAEIKAKADAAKLKVAIHNKNGQGLLQNIIILPTDKLLIVAIHNKNGQGLLLKLIRFSYISIN